MEEFEAIAKILTETQRTHNVAVEPKALAVPIGRYWKNSAENFDTMFLSRLRNNRVIKKRGVLIYIVFKYTTGTESTDSSGDDDDEDSVQDGPSTPPVASSLPTVEDCSASRRLELLARIPSQGATEQTLQHLRNTLGKEDSLSILAVVDFDGSSEELFRGPSLHKSYFARFGCFDNDNTVRRLAIFFMLIEDERNRTDVVEHLKARITEQALWFDRTWLEEWIDQQKESTKLKGRSSKAIKMDRALSIRSRGVCSKNKPKHGLAHNVKNKKKILNYLSCLKKVEKYHQRQQSRTQEEEFQKEPETNDGQ